MNSTPELIQLKDWNEFGGGFTASSYYHNTDNSIMMKLYANFMPPEEALVELEFSERVAALGFTIAKPLKYVKAEDGRFGAVFERLQNKKSFARIVADEPERLDEMAKIFAEVAKKIHSTPCNTEAFKSAEERTLEAVNAAKFLPQTLVDNIKKVLAEVPKTTTCLHGDFHIGNFLMVGDTPYLIDLGDFCYGNPMYDLGMFRFQWACSNDETCNHLYHINVDTMHKFWDKFLENYTDCPQDIEEKIKPYTMLTAVKYATKIGGLDDFLTAAIKDYL